MAPKSITIPALEVRQPIGRFYLGVIKSSDLINISSVDMRRIAGDLDKYVGIQRKLSVSRVKEIGSFVNSIDAVFPASVVLSVPGSCASFASDTRELTLKEGEDEDSGKVISFEEIANILDGQHRVDGLRNFRGDEFDVPVSIFVDADIADQAYIFATVNLAQTKVNRSLVYDLLDYAKSRSPQKSCHDVAVALDGLKGGPFYKIIKRLGTATPGRTGETLAQATFVGALLPFITRNAEEDRYRAARGKAVRVNDFTYEQTPFRGLWVDNRDSDIARIVNDYFGVVRDRWPEAWATRDPGLILPRTNGFRAFMRFLKTLYLHEKPSYNADDPLLLKQTCQQVFNSVSLTSADFNSVKYPPGTSGESALFGDLRRLSGL